MRRLEDAFRITDKKCALKEEELPQNIMVNNGYNRQLNFLLNFEINQPITNLQFPHGSFLSWTDRTVRSSHIFQSSQEKYLVRKTDTWQHLSIWLRNTWLKRNLPKSYDHGCLTPHISLGCALFSDWFLPKVTWKVITCNFKCKFYGVLIRGLEL